MTGVLAQSVYDGRDFLTRLGDSLSSAFTTLFSALPNIIGALLMLLIGWIIAGVVGKAISALLHTIKFNQFVDRTGFTQVAQRSGMKNADGSSFLAGLVKWFVFLFFVLSAANILGVQAISNVVTEIIAYIPNIFVALIILLIGSLVGQFVGRLVYGAMSATGEQGTASTLARVAHYGVFGFFIVAALNQLGIATNIISLLFGAIVFGLALAFGLAFGLGGRDAAARAIDRASSGVSNVASRAANAPRPMNGDTRVQVAQTPLSPAPTQQPPQYGQPSQQPTYINQPRETRPYPPQSPYIAPGQKPDQNSRG